eukprot:gnl/MRDRNA2_/MRDRNA2_107044_c0_seq1.p1 gnl/MRDRNA2_/MRDRNA2_107044_c0~~gnl/MRDRNA2_/MRDRNA2_107044_c0_seq1.p1  ORF type:complete len:471 (+),score=75.12 gnl/MRDRNA2_/MRDRNA2_107044_c0_seq1:114-1526(+)
MSFQWLMFVVGLSAIDAVMTGNLRARNHTQAPKVPQAPVADVNLALSNFQNVQYMGHFYIGGQDLPVIYDTGSFEIIVLSDLCKHCETAGPKYSSGMSSTFNPGQKLVAQHTFGSGPVLSKKGLETVHVGTVASPLVAQQMPFWQVMDHDIDVWDKHSKFSGIIGLGHSATTPEMDSDNSTKVYGKDESLLEKVGVTAFSICLERSAGTPNGHLIMGPTAEDARYDSTTFKHVPVVGDIHWAVLMSKLSASGQETHDACNPSCAAIVDSGTSLIAAPTSALQALAPILTKIDPECGNLDTLPDITFTLGQDTFTLPPAIYVIRVTGYVEDRQDVWEAMFGPPKLKAVTQCVPAFMEINMVAKDHGPVWILGMPFLRYYYTVFQRNPKFLHIAYATADCRPSGDVAAIYNLQANMTTMGLANTSVLQNTTARASVASQIVTVDPNYARLPSWAIPGMKTKKGSGKLVHLDF